MAKTDDDYDDRYLVTIKKNYSYLRRIPAAVARLDPRTRFIKQSLKTRDIAVARLKRDLLEKADDEQWAAMLTGNDPDAGRKRYLAMTKRAEAMGLRYKTVHDILAQDHAEALSRVEVVLDARTAANDVVAALGLEERPSVTWSQAYKIFVDEIAPGDIAKKSDNQKRQWLKVKQRAVNNFIKLVGDKPIASITRDDALVVHSYWNKRIYPKAGEPTASPNSGNRDIGNMRSIFERYHEYIGERDRSNPFHKLGFDEVEMTRPPFPTDWLLAKFLQPGRLANLNEEARGIFLALIETGARPSELANLLPNQIRLNDEVPHITIKARNGREIKTENSERDIPLVGVALEVFRKHPKGFPRYIDKEDHLSNTINKFLKENDLLPEPPEEGLPYSVYSIRHSFEDRMQEADVGDDMRRAMMGHDFNRSKYGTKGGLLTAKLREHRKIELPFDQAVV